MKNRIYLIVFVLLTYVGLFVSCDASLEATRVSQCNAPSIDCNGCCESNGYDSGIDSATGCTCYGTP